MDKNKFCSIIITHFGSNAKRVDLFRESLESLKKSTNYPYELIVIDNGGPVDAGNYLMEKVRSGEINTYIRNNQNMHFGYSRNQGLSVANGDYICIADNDIIYHKGWLEACIEVLEAYPNEKIYATPLYNVAHWLSKYWSGKVLEAKGKVYKLNSRAGSNCFVLRRDDFEKIGRFRCHRVAGTKWTEKAIGMEYMAAVAPEIMVKDMGFRDGYNYKECLPIKVVLSNGKEVHFNQDEFRYDNRGLHYIQQGEFDPKNSPRDQGVVPAK